MKDELLDYLREQEVPFNSLIIHQPSTNQQQKPGLLALSMTTT